MDTSGLAPIMAQLTILFGAHATSYIGAAAILILLIAHGAMPYLPVPADGAKGFYTDAYNILRLLSGNYRNAAPATPPAPPPPSGVIASKAPIAGVLLCAGLLGALSSCAAVPWLADAQLIVNGLVALEPVLATALGNNAAKVQADIAEAQIALSDVTAVSGSATAVAAIDLAVRDLAPYATALPAPYSGYASAAAALLPVVVAEESGTPSTPPPVAAANAIVVHRSLTEDQARGVLAQLPSR
jgi:hypothetical protein